jgi:hypothetical protein
VWRPSTVAEHRELAVRDEETANAPGRSEGRCEPHLAQRALACRVTSARRRLRSHLPPSRARVARAEGWGRRRSGDASVRALRELECPDEGLEHERRMHCTEWPCGARAPSPSTASLLFVMRRPRMPPAGPRGGASPTSRGERSRAASRRPGGVSGRTCVPCGARAPSPSTASLLFVMRRPRMPRQVRGEVRAPPRAASARVSRHVGPAASPVAPASRVAPEHRRRAPRARCS